VPSSHRSGLILHTSNRLECLADQLASVLARPLPTPLTSEIIVVQSNGMRRWLAQQIAQRHGICANVSFPFPQKFFGQVLETVIPGTIRSEIFDRDVMTWRIVALLPVLAEHELFASVANYIRGPDREMRAYQLARKIAGLFDRYLVYRPDFILKWDQGEGEDWQPILWRGLQRAAPGQHQPALGLRLATALKNPVPEGLPERVAVFGISTLPPFYVALIEQLAAAIEIHLFVMEPTPEWWGDIRSNREKARASAKQPELFEMEDQSEDGNTLLAANGKLGRDFLNLIADLNPSSHRENFVPPAGDTILSRVQRDIFEMGEGANQSRRAPANDCSLQIHSCHSPTRELEVLHDQLLAIFERDPSLKPQDIIVMTPDVSTYAPIIDAVFGVTENSAHEIPYTIADRGMRASSGVTDTFLRILETLSGRFGASEVLAILESPAVQRKFEIAEIDTVRRWISRCGIRWGIDGEHRARLGLPKFAENTWRSGLERMLLGYALKSDQWQLFEGVLPNDDIEGLSGELLGHFVDFAERLFALADNFRKPRLLVDWRHNLRKALDDFLEADNDDAREVNHLRAAIARLGELAHLSQNSEIVSLEPIIAQLQDSLAESSTGAGFLAGATTFCALKPMRGIPFKVVCLLGMNDTAYPRHDRTPSFDLILQHPRLGDRNVRDDDRALFLEALLSARDVFYVSYVGRSLRDNKELPPSVVVSELTDYIERSFSLADHLVVEHPLQAFSRRYFTGGRMFSYSVDNCDAGSIAEIERKSPLPLVRSPLAEPGPEWREIDLAQLIEFFSNPAKFFVRHRLGLQLPREARETMDREPFQLDPLDRYRLEQILLRDSLDDIDIEARLEMAKAMEVLPHGEPGALIFAELCENARSFAATIRDQIAVGTAESLELNEGIEEFTLAGRIDEIRSRVVTQYRLATLKPKDHMAIWLKHLARNLVEPGESLLVGREKTIASYRFPPTLNARELIRDLLELYWRGLREPLRFFPNASWVFAEKLFIDGEPARARFAAERAWRGDERHPAADSRDPYIELAFRNVGEPLDREWEELTRQILAPLFECREQP
jgi:exodeoxyribonuclease V gamma subunit